MSWWRFWQLGFGGLECEMRNKCECPFHMKHESLIRVTFWCYNLNEWGIWEVEINSTSPNECLLRNKEKTFIIIMSNVKSEIMHYYYAYYYYSQYILDAPGKMNKKRWLVVRKDPCWFWVYCNSIKGWGMCNLYFLLAKQSKSKNYLTKVNS